MPFSFRFIVMRVSLSSRRVEPSSFSDFYRLVVSRVSWSCSVVWRAFISWKLCSRFWISPTLILSLLASSLICFSFKASTRFASSSFPATSSVHSLANLSSCSSSTFCLICSLYSSITRVYASTSLSSSSIRRSEFQSSSDWVSDFSCSSDACSSRSFASASALSF